MWYIITSLILLWVVYSVAIWLRDRKSGGQLNTTAVRQPSNPDECCGKHSDCARNFLVKPKAAKTIDYYNDEELDAYRGVAEDAYTEQAADEFREVLYSLRENEVPTWLQSLQQRNISLPQTVKEEAMFIITDPAAT